MNGIADTGFLVAFANRRDAARTVLILYAQSSPVMLFAAV